VKRKERAEILEAKKEKEAIYQDLKAKEQEILAELKAQEIQNQQLQNQIQEAIQREIREEQARLEKLRLEAEAKRKAEEAKRKEGVATVAEPKKETPLFLETKEAELAGNTFALNKGRLPWPVEKGTITVNYGKNAHPTLPGVYTQNNGVDISTPKNAVVRAVFDGEVTSVLNIPGAGKAVIVKHGNYRTVYSNLQDVYVTKGAKVTTKTPLGSLLPSKDGNISIAHFEIHELKDRSVNQLNPNLWITK
jgi:murein hydrolase activator